MAERFSCALASRALGEPCYATASQVRRWLLVEQPGAWGADAVVQSDLRLETALRLRDIAQSVRARLLLIRRHGRSSPGGRTCFAVVTTADVRRVEQFEVETVEDLLDVDWAPLRAFAPVGGQRTDTPLYLVCTNGSHDVCCAEFGRPVARALDEALGAPVWEASHYGGDRFAGNLVCLPDGVYYGRVDPHSALGLVRRLEDGHLDLDHYRGRCFQPFVAQAAEHLVREARGLTALDGALARQVEDLGAGSFRVLVALDDGEALHATVSCSETVDPQQLTCRAASEEHPPRYRLVDLA